MKGLPPNHPSVSSIALFGLLIVSFGPAVRAAAAAPSFSHVFIVMEENRSYSDVVGSPLMPYFNMLIDNYGLATGYYANTHPSLPNYLWATSGSNDGVTRDTCSTVVSADNAVRELVKAGVSWKTYQQGLPSIGFLGCSSGHYVKRHNPFVYYTDVINSVAQSKRVVPLTRLSHDIANNTLARYNFIVPNVCNDMHSDSTCSNGCTSTSSSACWTAADKWLVQHISPLLNDSIFQPGGSALLIITFDESVGSDETAGGGHVAWVVIGPLVKPGYRSSTFYQHQSTLRLMLEGLGVSQLPNGAATAPDMDEFFN
jgi:phospholipase C